MKIPVTAAMKGFSWLPVSRLIQLLATSSMDWSSSESMPHQVTDPLVSCCCCCWGL